MKRYIILFFTMLKIGLFTFGGGYAMLPLLENEFVEKKKWIDSNEFSDMIAVAESTPGPLAVNSATYIGYKIGKIAGAVLATAAVCIPSFVIIYSISLFFDGFMEMTYIRYAFNGVRMCVIYLILSTGIKLLKKLKRSVFNYVVFAAIVACIILFSVFTVDFSSVFYILISGGAGLVIYLIKYFSAKTKAKDDNDAA